MKLKPLDDRVVVRPCQAESQTPGGIMLPEMAQEKSERGAVVAVGPGHLFESGQRIPVAVQVGDQVLFAKYAGADIEVEGEKLKMLREGELLGKFVGE